MISNMSNDKPEAGKGASNRSATIPITAESAPEPVFPQGDYAFDGVGQPLLSPEVQRREDEGAATSPEHEVELLAPAGGPDCGYAAFQYGADAIYLGLKIFSARAEAENFSLEEVDAITAYAHSLPKPRRIFVTINTVIKQNELDELIDTLSSLSDIGVDALIIQDLGVYYLVRKYFPNLALHGSTQMAIHNIAGAKALKAMGFAMVVLARELTLEEIGEISQTVSIPTEVFIHGALCYAYSGLCLFSSQTLGRSGNRGRCAYSCRDDYRITGAPLTLRDGTPVKRDPRTGFPFSMKDLALPDHLPALRSAGVSSFKIEGRKKNALFVATVTDYYRRMLKQDLDDDDRARQEADLQTIFSRPWTQLFVDSHKDKEVADRDTVGHRGTAIGSVERIFTSPEKHTYLRFHTNRRIEHRDGIQIDLPKLGRPFGFSVVGLRIVKNSAARNYEDAWDVFVAEAGSLVDVQLPKGYPPIPLKADIYCSASQAVKQAYKIDVPKSGTGVRVPININGILRADSFELQLQALGAEASDAKSATDNGFPSPERVEVTGKEDGVFEAARDVDKMNQAFTTCLQKLGATSFSIGMITFDNPEGLFVPMAQMNGLRRKLTTQLEERVKGSRDARRLALKEELVRLKIIEGVPVGETAALPDRPSATVKENIQALGWSIKIDRVAYVEAFQDADWESLDEVVVDIARDSLPQLREGLAQLVTKQESQVGRDRIRLALPALTRKWEETGLQAKIKALWADGWRKWEASNVSAWSYLGQDPTQVSSLKKDRQVDWASDWPMYILNRAAAQQVQAMGVTRFALSPEDGRRNMGALLSAFPEQAVVIVYQDTPLFVAESCAYANLIGGCPGKANCSFVDMEMESSHGEKVTAVDYHCRTIVFNQDAFCLTPHLEALQSEGTRHVRADFVNRRYKPVRVREIWRTLRSGKNVLGGHAANFDRGVI